MSIYVGFYRASPDYLREAGARARAGEPMQDPKLVRKVVELVDKLPTTCKILGAYNTLASAVLAEPGPPGVLIVDAAGNDDLQFINQHYAGYLQFQWNPAISVGTTRQEREETMAAAAQPAR